MLGRWYEDAGAHRHTADRKVRYAGAGWCCLPKRKRTHAKGQSAGAAGPPSRRPLPPPQEVPLDFTGRTATPLHRQQRVCVCSIACISHPQISLLAPCSCLSPCCLVLSCLLHILTWYLLHRVIPADVTFLWKCNCLTLKNSLLHSHDLLLPTICSYVEFSGLGIQSL